MGHPIRITAGSVIVTGQLNDTPTAAAVLDALPLEATGNRWGEEIYFEIPVNQPSSADARSDMEVGELASWPTGNAFCIFFGPTPVSEGDVPRAASPVNPIGALSGDVAELSSVPDGATVRVEMDTASE